MILTAQQSYNYIVALYMHLKEGNNMNTIDKFNSHVTHSYSRYPLVMEKGSGRRCKDENGKEYIDLGRA